MPVTLLLIWASIISLLASIFTGPISHHWDEGIYFLLVSGGADYILKGWISI